MTTELIILLVYLAAISLLSLIVCCYDKFAAKHLQKHRTRERTLLLLSALGGSVAMLLTMLVIRHKTKHLKFMLGIPVIMAIQLLILVFFLTR
ncbi:MAG: DUF1294 domain-containing protein [Clostridia bacterium]|nr:DUF1294 domain-containing protein [Clostridia bacterium]